MAIWIYNRPVAQCDETELKVAQLLSRLPDSWIVRWGFYYHRDREGDFLVLGPDGRVLVMEVKSGPLRRLANTGVWEGAEPDHPLNQLSAEWRGVIDRLRDSARGRQVPYVAKALGLPDVRVGQPSFYKTIDRKLILDQADLESLPTAWSARLFSNHPAANPGEARQVFIDAFAEEITPKALRHFISETDRILLRHASQEFAVLGMLRDNQQIVVQGGPGTGKTWLAFEQARRLAEEGQGRHVLLLCYNLALSRLLQDMVSRRPVRRGNLEVRSWEAIARGLFKSAEFAWAPPEEFEARRQYFEEIVPPRMAEAAARSDFVPKYDALVVDEAQDHDTCFLAEAPAEFAAGWWSVYLRMLRKGPAAPIAVFYDPAQRPLFRDRGCFDPALLCRQLSQPARFRLAHTVRYTRPVFEFLKRLASPTTSALVDSLGSQNSLPEGPEVEVYTEPRETTAECVRDILRRWTATGYCKIEDVLVLSPRGRHETTSLGGWMQLGDWPIAPFDKRRPGDLALLSVNRAKGLEALGVVLIDVPPFDAAAEGRPRMDYFMGASRARQLLAVVHAT